MTGGTLGLQKMFTHERYKFNFKAPDNISEVLPLTEVEIENKSSYLVT